MRPTAFACFLAAVMSNMVAFINLMQPSEPDSGPSFISFAIGAFFVPGLLAFAGILVWRSGEMQEQF